MNSSRDIERLRALSGIKWKRWDDDVIPAWVADMDFATAPAIVDALRQMVDSSDFGYNLTSFDDSIPKLWADWSERRFGWRPDPEHTRVFSTTLQPIAVALSIATSPGDGVLLFTPVYAPFFGIVEKAGRELVEYKLDQTEWRIDIDALRAAITPGTRAMVLCNPHNPSGRAFDASELAAVVQIAEEFDLLVISDEIWQDFVYPGAEHIPFASLGPEALSRSVIVTAASKSFNLGGLSCAVAHLGSPKVAKGVAELPPHLLGGINALGAHATHAAWEHGEDWLATTTQTLRANRDHLMARMAAELPEVHVATPEATYLAWLDFRDTSFAADPAKYLLESGRVGLSPGPDFGVAGAGFARVNFATSVEILDEIVDRMVTTLRNGPCT
ncbi:MAG: aminotransferase class I/II-fold pyridoxal phosphate-dependent enzyme [Actinomycetota bacterium]|nr:aminotransferase class I/II-fold pyridoxal phosphate-dependent enzyme [Actinomycetota bacterium]